MTRSFAVAVLSIVCGLACTTPPTPVSIPTAGHFSLILEHSSQGWRATCQVGCRWKEVTMTCGGCTVGLTSVGIGPADRVDSGATFAFTLTDAGSGWEAKSLQGAQWASLSWGCPQATCRARIDDSGVYGS